MNLIKNNLNIFDSFYNDFLLNFYVDNFYNLIIQFNSGSFLNRYNVESYTSYFLFFYFFYTFLKISLTLTIIFSIFFLTFLENYVTQLVNNNVLTKLFILNENEKEVGPADDFFFFTVIFILAIFSFIIMTFFVIILNNNIFVWSIASLFLVSIFILTIPLNLFIDFGISYFAYVRGSASSSSLIKELLFDIIATFTIFIRFVVQNIRFFFIFSAIFELLEWIFSCNSSFFFVNNFYNYNLFFNFSDLTHSSSVSNFNLLFINSIMFVIFYFYYSLHLIFLLLVQITIYIGISIWLFFFLYSTKFLGKYEKFFILKK